VELLLSILSTYSMPNYNRCSKKDPLQCMSKRARQATRNPNIILDSAFHFENNLGLIIWKTRTIKFWDLLLHQFFLPLSMKKKAYLWTFKSFEVIYILRSAMLLASSVFSLLTWEYLVFVRIIEIGVITIQETKVTKT